MELKSFTHLLNNKMSCTTLVSMVFICIVVMGTLVTSSSSDRIENEAHDIIVYNHLKRALLAKLTKYNSVKRALTADCSGNLKCMVWGKRALTEKKIKHKRFVSDFDKYAKKDLATTNLLKKDLSRHYSVKRALAADCSGNVKCMVWGKRALAEKRALADCSGNVKCMVGGKRALAEKRALADDCSGNVKCMVWGKRNITDVKDNHKRFDRDFDQNSEQKRALLSKLKIYNGFKRSLADCSGNVKCMIWGKRTFTES